MTLSVKGNFNPNPELSDPMKKTSENFLISLVNSIGPSGYEGPVANVWRDEAKTFASLVDRDAHGNTFATVNPGGDPVIMLAGHCDEIGFLITHIDKAGYCWLAPIGGWDPQIIQGQRVRVKGRSGVVPGVIGKKPIHLMSPDDRRKVVGLNEIWVDLGVESRKEAEALVAIGDPVVIAYAYERLAGTRAVARGMDNRVGAFVVLEAARRVAKAAKPPSASVVAVATVQEEIGCRGAMTAAHRLRPQVGIAVDLTFGIDHPGLSDAMRQENDIKVGKGPVITRGPNINPVLFDLIVDTAKQCKIPLQVNAEGRSTPTDADPMQLSRAGVATALLSVPNRYMHSPCELVDLKDIDACVKLIAETVVRIDRDLDFTPF